MTITDDVEALDVEPSEEERAAALAEEERLAAEETARAKPSKSVEWRAKRAADLKGRERRVRLEKFQLRETDDGMIHLDGYASVSETPYDMGWYDEVVSRGAAKKTLEGNPDVVLNLQHGEAGSGLPMARTKAGNLRISEDMIGLKVEADLDPEDPDVQLLYRKMQAGNLDGQMSFCFAVVRQTWNDDYSERRIVEYDIHRGDVSCVVQGASPTTSSSIRTDDALTALRHIGPIGVLEAFADLRRYAATPKEARDGLELSATAVEVLTQVLALTSLADDAMDEAQPLLAAVLGVANPDDDGEFQTDAERAEEELEADELARASALEAEHATPLFVPDFRADRARVDALRRRAS